MSRKIIGVTVGTTLPKPNFNQTDPTKGDYIRNKPDFDALRNDVNAIKTLVGDIPVSEQINTAIDNMIFITEMDIDIICGAISVSTSVALTDGVSGKSYELYINNGEFVMGINESDSGESNHTSQSYVVLVDITTNENYKLYINNGELTIELYDELSDTVLDYVLFVDENTNEYYKIYIDNGRLTMEISEV